MLFIIVIESVHERDHSLNSGWVVIFELNPI